MVNLSLLSLIRGFFWVLAGSLLSVVALILYNLYLHPLRHYPGPRPWCASRLAWIIALQRGTLHLDLKRLHDKYGPVVRIAPNELSYIDAAAWRDIYQSRPGHAVFERNSTWFRKQTPTEPWSIMGHNELAHSKYRRAFNSAFTQKALEDQAPLLESYVSLLVEKFREQIQGSTSGFASIDLVQWLNFLTFDISGDLSFGESFGSTKAGSAHPWVEISCQFGKGVALMASINFFPSLRRLTKYIIPEKVRTKMQYHRDLTKEKVHQRLEMGSERPDFVDAILKYNARSKGVEEHVTEAELALNKSIFIFAGSETTGTALSAIFRFLLQHPEPMAKLLRELRNTFDNEANINIHSVSNLEYLNAVINEGLRLAPPTAIGVPRIVPRGGETVIDRFVPEGTYVAVNQFAAFRSRSNFVQADCFVPERFVPSLRQPGDNFDVFHPFQTGRHMCIGMKFAMAELRFILAKLLFTFEITSGSEAGIQDWATQKTSIFWLKEPLSVRLYERSNQSTT